MECIIKLIPEDTPAKHTLDYIPVRLSNIYSQYHIFNLRIHGSPRESLSTVPAHRKQITTTKPATRISYQSTKYQIYHRSHRRLTISKKENRTKIKQTKRTNERSNGYNTRLSRR